MVVSIFVPQIKASRGLLIFKDDYFKDENVFVNIALSRAFRKRKGPGRDGTNGNPQRAC